MKFIKTLKYLKKNKPRIKKINKIIFKMNSYKLLRQNRIKSKVKMKRLLKIKKLNQLLKKIMKCSKNLKKFLHKGTQKMIKKKNIKKQV